MSERGILKDIPILDKKKAIRFVLYGLIVAVIFGTVMMVSRSINNNASSWENLANEENTQNYNAGLYGYEEYIKRSEEIDKIADWMRIQDIIFINIARLGVNISLIFIAIGFISLGVNDSIEDKTRRLYLILAGLILFMLMLTTFFTNISVSVS